MLRLLKLRLGSVVREQQILRGQESHETTMARRFRLNNQLWLSGYTADQRRRIVNKAMRVHAVEFDHNLTQPVTCKHKRVDFVGIAVDILRMVGGVGTGPKPVPHEWIIEREKMRDLRHTQRMKNRREARVLNLTYGFLRGVPYRAMEERSYTPPPWLAPQMVTVSSGRSTVRRKRLLPLTSDPIEAAAISYSHDTPQVVKQRLAEWKDAAGGWVHPSIVETQATRPTALQGIGQ